MMIATWLTGSPVHIFQQSALVSRSASGTRRQYPMIPAISRFIESNHSPHPAGFDRHSYSSTEDGMHRHNIHLSSRLPRRIWFLLAKALGIKLSHSDRPICATILHVFTLVAAMTFAIPGGWYTIYDIHSEFSKTTVLIGSVQLIIGFGWACMGVYAHNIAGRLFSNKNFVECVRVHSKTFLKISTSWLTLFLGVLVISVNCYEAAPIFYDDTCGTVQIEILVCQVFFVGRVVYAVTSLLWNFIVVYVLFSVCRTHTIGECVVLSNSVSEMWNCCCLLYCLFVCQPVCLYACLPVCVSHIPFLSVCLSVSVSIYFFLL